jgi:hypothetical protein
MISGKTYRAGIWRVTFAAVRFILSASCVLTLVPFVGWGQQNDAGRIAAAVLPLPENMRAAATVASVDKGVESVLREGTNGMVCTADQPGDQMFSVNCFHETVHALLRRMAELSRELKDKALTEALESEIKAGKLKPPVTPSIGFQMRGPLSGYDPATNSVSKEIKTWQMVMLPYATGASLSLPEKSDGNMPWVMGAGTWAAHIMIEHQ